MPTICVVSGTVLQTNGTPLAGVVVSVTLDRPFIYPTTGEVVPNSVQNTTTAADGTWSLSVIETTTSGVSVTFAFIYLQSAGASNQRYEYTATIPNTTSANFSDIINTSSDSEGFVPPVIPQYATVADLPTSAANGFLATVATSPASLYEFDLTTTTWNLVGPGGGSPSGITSINADTTVAQTIVVGSSGTDFAITTTGGVTTIGIPTASITNRGLLSSADWFTFNAKQNSIISANLTAPGTDGIAVTGGTGSLLSSASIAQQVANTSQNGYLSSTDWNTFNNKGAGTVTSVAVASANGLAGSSSGGATPSLTLSTTITGIAKGNGTALSAATSGTDYSAGTSSLSTGIVKSTTSTGALSIAISSDFPTLNQNTSGTATNVTATTNSTLTTLSSLSLPGTQVSGNISGNAANVTGIVAIANGGTGATRPGLLSVVAKTTTYLATVSDDVITASGSAFTITLPAATTLGKVLQFKKTDSSLTNIITITAGSGDNIDGASSITLNTQFESVEIVADGTHTWNLLNRSINDTTSTAISAFVAGGGFGTVSTSSFVSKRIGDSLQVWGTFTVGTASGTAASITLPSGIAIGKLPTTATGTIVGEWITSAGSTLNMFTTPNSGVIFYDGSTSGSIFFTGMSGTTGLIKSGGSTVSGTGLLITVNFLIPVVGWN